jgi:hypothetical protein
MEFVSKARPFWSHLRICLFRGRTLPEIGDSGFYRNGPDAIAQALLRRSHEKSSLAGAPFLDNA